MPSKKSERQRWRAWRRALSDSERTANIDTAISALLERPEWTEAQCVALYVALPSEPDLSPLIADAHRRGVRVALPVVTGPAKALVWRAHGPGEPLIPGNFRVPEPPPQAPAVPPATIDLVVVPGLAVDNQGYRLGYGGGYYDRSLPAMSRAGRIWLGTAAQLVEALPRDTYDVPVFGVVTEAGFAPRPC